MRADLDNLETAVAKHRPTEAFMNAASPGVISAFQSNRYYPTHEAYVDAIATAPINKTGMRPWRSAMRPVHRPPMPRHTIIRV